MKVSESGDCMACINITQHLAMRIISPSGKHVPFRFEWDYDLYSWYFWTETGVEIERVFVCLLSDHLTKQCRRSSIHRDVSVKLLHQQPHSEWNGLASSLDAKLQACTTIVWWSQFDCEEHFSRTTKHLSQCAATSEAHANLWSASVNVTGQNETLNKRKT